MASRLVDGKKNGVENTRTTNQWNHESVQLDVIVIGAGIAGLTAAITLSRAGHKVTVLEKSEFKKEAGFMITLGSNAITVLSSFDFDYKRARSVNCESIETLNGHTLESFQSNGMKDFESRPGLQARTFYRPDLHEELKRIMLVESENFITPVLRLGSLVVNVNIETATVVMKDGTTVSGDLIVAADGERSLVKKQFGNGHLLRQAPYKLFRVIVPTERLSTDERDLAMLAMTDKKFAIFQSLDRAVSWFQGRDGLLQDLECGYGIRDEEDAKLETDPKIAYDKMMERFADFHPDIVNVLRKAELVSDWEVYYSKTLPHLHKHKAVLIGDAGHSMFPTTGQGGAQGIEDAGALGVLLASLTSKSDLGSRLGLFEELRKERIGVVQALSPLIFGMEGDFAKARPNHPVVKMGIITAAKHMQYLFEYDILTKAKKVLERSLRAKASL